MGPNGEGPVEGKNQGEFDDSWTAAGDDFASFPEQYEVLLEAKVERRHKQDIPDDVMEAVARQKATKTQKILDPFGRREYDSFAAFTKEWSDYEAAEFLHYRVRDSTSATKYNVRLEDTASANGTEVAASDFIPSGMGYASKTLRCTHGIYQKSRGTGKRKPRTTRYTECDARITARARQLPSGKWIVQTVSEVIRHNHKCSKVVFDSYKSASVLIEEHHLFDNLELMILAKTPTRNICDVIAMRHGVHLTAQQISNFKRDRLGGQGALYNLRLLLQRFAAFDGSRCLIIEDESGLVCGIVMQSAAQRAMLERYGDSLILDWTHNTNNVGYYLGALMVTSVSGSGVSVLDFLCLAQTKDMMETVFSFFLKWNPGAQANIRSIVIDKDYAEWMVLMTMFPDARVVFCQFHVVKWFAQVVQDEKYALSAPVQERVRAVLRDMVYARTKEAFASQQWLLQSLLSSECPAFLDYMAERWYPHRHMWSDCERGTVFTATNTTSNRIESSWGQVKAILGLKLRIDMCLEAVFTYQTAVMRREYACIETIVGPKSLLRSTSDRFMRPVLSQVSDYCATTIDEQYEAQLRMIGNYFVMPEPDTPDRYVVERLEANGTHRTVDVADWSCSCDTFITTELPCRHIIYVSREHRRDSFLPLAVLRPRWALNAAVPVMPSLKVWIKELQTLRTGLLLVDHPPADARVSDGGAVDDSDCGGGGDCQDDLAFLGRDPSRRLPNVAHVRLSRGEVAANVVLDNLEKRNIVEAEFAPIVKYMMAQSTPRFKDMHAYMREMIDGLLVAFKKIPLTDADRAESSAAVHTTDEIPPAEQIREMVRAAVNTDTPCVSAPQIRRGSGSASCDTAPSTFRVDRPTTQPPINEGRTDNREAYTASNRERSACVRDPVTATHQRDDDVSSLSMSCASSIIQAVAVQNAASPSSPPPTARVSPDPLASRTTRDRSCAPILPGPTATSTKRSADQAGLSGGLIDKFVLRVRDGVGVTKTQKAKAKATARLGFVRQGCDCPVTLCDFVPAARSTRDVLGVLDRLRSYPVMFDEDWLEKRPVVVTSEYVTPASFSLNFTIPSVLLEHLESAIRNEKSLRPESSFVDLNTTAGSMQLVTRIKDAHAVRGFSNNNVATIRSFYDTQRSCKAYELDAAWLKCSGEETTAQLRDQVVSVMDRSALSTRFHLSPTNENSPTSIQMSDVLGHLAGDAWLNDSVLVYALRQIADDVDGLCVVDSIRPGVGRIGPVYPLPERNVVPRQSVIFPVNVSGSHWCLICVSISATAGVRVVFFDSLARQTNIQTLHGEWVKQCEPFVRAWWTRDYEVDYISPQPQIVTTPRQADSDGTSCGLYCLATASDFATGSAVFRSKESLPLQAIHDLRLRAMWGIFCASADSWTAGEAGAAATMQRYDAFVASVGPIAKANGKTRGPKKKAKARS